jgi:hypothetical protein
MSSKNNNSPENFMREMMRRRVQQIANPAYKPKNLNETLTNEIIKATSYAANLYADNLIINEFNDPKSKKLKIKALVSSYKNIKKEDLKNTLAELQTYHDVVMELLNLAELKATYFQDQKKSEAASRKEKSKRKNVKNGKFSHHNATTKIINDHFESLEKEGAIKEDGYLSFKSQIFSLCSQQSISPPPSNGKISKAWKDKTGFSSTKKVSGHKSSK